MTKNIELKVNGQKITLNRFVETVFNNVIMGLVDSLDKIPEVKTIDIQITEGDK
jgi:hypothetical protein